MMVRLCLVVLLLALSAVAEPVIPRSLSKLEQAPPVCADSFDFIVTGDTQSNSGLAIQTDLFKGMIREWNVLQPACVLEVGDIILGGSAENLPQQWDLFLQTIAPLQPPYFSAPGNHDISDGLSEKLWIDRMGPTRYAFTCGNSRFIVLDSEEVEALDRLSDEQVAWFKHELETCGAKNIFVFLHQPYFTDELDPRAEEPTWGKRWQYLADLMHGYPVRAVFAGHIHEYRDFGVRDGVHYAIVGGGAVKNGPDESGQFSHYVQVRVRGTDVSWSVIKPGSVLPMNVATINQKAELTDIKRRLVSTAEMPVRIGEGFDADVSVRIETTIVGGFESTVSWDVPEGWKVEPLTKDYAVPAAGSIEVPFHVTWTGSGPAMLPAPKYKTLYKATMFIDPLEVENEMSFVPTWDAPRAPKDVKLDGKLDEWTGAAPVRLNYPTGFKEGEYAPSDISGACRAMWSEDELYLAFELEDNEHFQPYGGDIVWLADCIEFHINHSAWGVSLTGHGPEVFHYFSEGISAETVNKDAQLAVHRENGRTTYEAAFPARLIKHMDLASGSSFTLNALVSDVDRLEGPKHELALTPGGLSSTGLKLTLR